LGSIDTNGTFSGEIMNSAQVLRDFGPGNGIFMSRSVTPVDTLPAKQSLQATIHDFGIRTNREKSSNRSATIRVEDAAF
jgi:hypothetical protein